MGAVLTAIPGSSLVYKGGIISYTNTVKEQLLQVPSKLLSKVGAVSAPVAEAMAEGVRHQLGADVAVSVTGLAGPGGDEFSNPVGTVFVGYADDICCISKEYHFTGDRQSVRNQAIDAALSLVLEHNR